LVQQGQSPFVSGRISRDWVNALQKAKSTRKKVKQLSSMASMFNSQANKIIFCQRKSFQLSECPYTDESKTRQPVIILMLRINTILHFQCFQQLEIYLKCLKNWRFKERLLRIPGWLDKAILIGLKNNIEKPLLKWGWKKFSDK
jgi:hypothetical protein